VFGHTIEAHTAGTVFDSYPLVLQAAAAGHGIALGWRRTAGKLIREGALIRPCEESVHLPHAISVYRERNADERVEVHALLGWLQEQLLMTRE
jgi:LysR family glycine cleavage system transcriptional activator